MAESTGEKSHDPTPHRRQQARAEGHVARSQDLGSAVLLIGATGCLLLLGGSVVEFVAQLARRQLGGEAWLSTDIPATSSLLSGLVSTAGGTLLPLLGVMFLLAIAGNALQVGFLFLPSRVMPDLSRIDPLAGLTRLGSPANFVRLGLGVAKLVVVAGVSGYCLLAERDRILNCGQLPLPQLALFLTETLVWTTLKIGVALLAVAGLDYAYARWRHERDLRMTTAELREEMRNLQGNPQTRARRKSFGRQLQQSRGDADLAGASVIIAHDHHVAVALRYDERTMSAPQVVAAGTGAAAARIRSLASARRVTIVERPQLARTIERTVAMNRAIPPHLYAQVAEVLPGRV